ncbi:MAG: universal stress protein [Alphaproteobacteria bacterium]|nr:universal stress protein [Alphaproteobacteria bacterium]
MSYKTIVVHCDTSTAGANRLKYAIKLARRHDAHLIGIGVTERAARPSYVESPYIVELLRQHQERQEAERADLAEAFKQATNGSGLRVEWRHEDGEPPEVLGTALRYADVGVVGQFEPDGPMPEEWQSLPETLAMSSGRPIIVVPYIGGAEAVDGHVLLAWNASHEATRAASDALPMLRTARKVTVMVVDGSVRGVVQQPHGQEPGADVAAWLARHDVKVDVVRDTSGDIDVGSIILSRASDLNVDMVVMGIYGHSRLRELVLGGVSRTMLQQMTVPVLIAH